MTDQIFATGNDWALVSDGVQWVLMRRKGPSWRAMAFVRSGKDILARCMRERCVDVAEASFLLSGLPDTFDQWKASHAAL